MAETNSGAGSSENPFLEFEEGVMRQSSPSAILLRDLVLHLYRGHGNLDLRALLRDSGRPCGELALSMLDWFAKHGEGCSHFLRVAGAVESDSYFF